MRERRQERHHQVLETTDRSGAADRVRAEPVEAAVDLLLVLQLEGVRPGIAAKSRPKDVPRVDSHRPRRHHRLLRHRHPQADVRRVHGGLGQVRLGQEATAAEG